MRILHLGKYYPPDRGGMETALEVMAEGLLARGHRVEVLVSASQLQGRVVQEERFRLEALGSWGTLASQPINPDRLVRLRRRLQEFNPHIVHLHLPDPLGALAWMMVGDGRPLVISYHSDIVRQRWLGALWGPVRRRLLRRASAVVASSEGLTRESSVLSALGREVAVIPLAIDPARHDRPEPARIGEWERRIGAPFFLMVGRQVYYKGVDILLKALRGHPALHAVIVGDGPCREEWETLARVWGLSGRAHFVGWQGEANLRALYQGCQALILPSIESSETFGLVQLEAMACRRPVLVSRASAGVVSIPIEGETGFLFDVGDSTALAEKMELLLARPELADRLGRAGRARLEAFFAQKGQAERLERLYRRVLD